MVARAPFPRRNHSSNQINGIRLKAIGNNWRITAQTARVKPGFADRKLFIV